MSFQRIIRKQYTLPKYIDETASDLIDKLIQINPEERIGFGKGK